MESIVQLQLTNSQVQYVLACLAEQPYKNSAPVIVAIVNQLKAPEAVDAPLNVNNG